jgi:predicted Fe-S protein YdhL (DUF1289 family)
MMATSPPDEIVDSPCIAVCEMMPDAGLCAGCFRTLDEIAAWGSLDAAGRRAVLARLPARRARWGEAAQRIVRAVTKAMDEPRR